jgi:hypothetical protein
VHTNRDQQIVAWLGELGAAGAEHVGARFGMGRSWTYRRLQLLVADGLLAERRLLHQQPGLRLSILAELELARWLTPHEDATSIDLLDAIRSRTVVYFRLDADRRPLLSEMLAAAVVSDLVTLVAELHRGPIPAVVVLDEFAAIAAGQIGRLFGRARSAGISLVLGTQELADLRKTDKGLLDQVLGNLSRRDRPPPECARVRRAARRDGRLHPGVGADRADRDRISRRPHDRPRHPAPRLRVPASPLAAEDARRGGGGRYLPGVGAGAGGGADARGVERPPTACR